MRNLKIKFFVSADTLAIETPKLLKKWNDIGFKTNRTWTALRRLGQSPLRYHFIPTYWMLKTFYKVYGKYNNKITWLPCEYDTRLSIEYFIDLIDNEKPDILCFGFYTWNEIVYVKLITEIKKKYSDIIIIGGGPSIREKDILNAVDFAIYGDGEESFTILLDILIENKSDFTEVPNLIYKEKNQIFTNPFKIFKYKEFNLPSAYLDNKEEIKTSVEKIRNKYKSYVDPSISWEFTRGCPYACAFCDWSSGLHHKVTSRKNDWKKDLDFLISELGCSLYLTDANFGLMKEDLEIADYLLETALLRDSIETDLRPNLEKVYPLLETNWDKLHKDRTYKLMDKVLIHYPETPIKISIQDINEDVLEAIHRPEIPWEEHKRHILNLRSNHPNCFLIFEIIAGFPKQTLNSWLEMLFELDSVKANFILPYWWQLLLHSPASEKEYRDKNNLTTSRIKELNWSFEMHGGLTLNNTATFDIYSNKSQIWSNFVMIHENHSDELKVALHKIAAASLFNGIRQYPDFTNNSYKEIYLKCRDSLNKFLDSQYKLMMSTNKRDNTVYICIVYENYLSNFKHFFHRPDIIKKLVENTI